MGVQSRIVLYAPSGKMAEAAAKAAFARIDQLEQIMSDYRADSEINRLSGSAGGRPVRVSEDLYEVLSRSEELARKSSGAFDVTAAPVIQLWRKARTGHALPSEADLKNALQLVGWRMLKLDRKARSAQLLKKGMRLDLGGIGKGYACDAALSSLRSCGVTRALVEMGGDMALGEAPPGAKGWRIEIAHSDRAHRTVTLSRCGVSSSGDTEQFVEIGGTRYSHIVDPRTGVGLTSRVAVTVIAPNATTSDGLSTALCVLDPDEGMKLLRELGGVKAYRRIATD